MRSEGSISLRRGAGVLALLLSVVALGFAPGTAVADDPVYLPWTDQLPSIATPYDPTSKNPCKNGSLRCVDLTIDEMTRSFDGLAETCSHDAVFSLVYLRVTEAYERTVAADPSFFYDTLFVNHEDAIFAAYYFVAYDAWYRGQAWLVPRAWQIAFEAADAHRVSGSGNVLLGINAHVNRDLPFVLAAMGLFNKDGSSRKPDHDKVNTILIRVEGDALAEASRRFDPSILDPTTNGTSLDETALYQTLAAWREDAWRNAERLATASSPAAWAAVAQNIEDSAALEAQAIAAQYAYTPPVTSTTARDAYCAEHWADPYP